MKRAVYLFLVLGLLSCSTKELKNTLLGVDIWINVDNRNVEGTDLKVKEITEISFRDSILTRISILEGDTISNESFTFNWKLKYPDKIKYNKTEIPFHKDLTVTEYNDFELRLTGILPWDKVYVFRPKIR